MSGSLHEAQAVRAPRGVARAPQAVRRLADRSAVRARRVPQGEPPACADPVAGRRVESSREGGRRRRRAHTRGPQTTKGRQRSTGAGRAPQGRQCC